MSPKATRNIQLGCVYIGPVFALTWSLGLILFAGFIPPLEPGLSVDAVARIYRENQTGILIGQLLMMTGAGLVPAWTAVIAIHIRRIERVPTLTYIQVGSGVFLMMTILLTGVIFATAAYRADRNPELTFMLNDLGWIMFVWTYAPFVTQILSLGIAVLLDCHKSPIFPRWSGYFNVWVALLSLPGGLIVFFKGGPFAWNGLLAFWIPLSVYGAWMAVNAYLMVKAIKNQPEVDVANGLVNHPMAR